MKLGLTVPTSFVIMGEMFDRTLRMNVAEFEFPVRIVACSVLRPFLHCMLTSIHNSLCANDDLGLLQLLYKRQASDAFHDRAKHGKSARGFPGNTSWTEA